MLDGLNLLWGLLIVAATWHYALLCGFVSDDHAVIESRTDIIPEGEKSPKKEKRWIKIFNDGLVMYFLNKMLWKIAGKRAFGWHLFNYLIHLLNTYLVYLLAAQLLGPAAAPYAAIIWAVNPMQNQIVVWCSGRPYAIATCFALVAILNWQNPFIVIPAYFLGVITSLTVGFVPIIIKILHPGVRQANLYLCMVLLALPWVAWKFTQRFGKGALVLDRRNYQFKIKRINNLIRVYMYYLVVLICPVKMGWYHEGGFRYNEKWDGFNVWALLGYITVFLIAREGAVGWLFLLGMLPNMNLFATNSYLQDRYVYFGSIGLAILVTPFLYQYPVVFVAVAAIYAHKAYNYSRYMRNDTLLYRENWRYHLGSPYAVNNLGFFLIQDARYEEARAIIKRGLDMDRNNKLLWYNLGITYAAQGNINTQQGQFSFFRALDCWKRALQIEPRWRKPKEDIDKLVKFLIDSKVLTQKKTEAMPGTPSMNMPTIALT